MQAPTRGASFFSTLLLLAAAGGAYYGISILPMYSDQLDLRGDARTKAAQIMAQSATIESAKQDLLDSAKRLGIDLHRGDIDIQVAGGRCVIKVSYVAYWKLKFTNEKRQRRMNFTAEAVNLGAM